MNLVLLKITKFEFWPWKIFYLPLIPYYIYLGLKNKSLTFPSNVNYALKDGGLFDENKKEILSKLPSENLPKSVFVDTNLKFFEVKNLVLAKSLDFPIVAKPLDEQRGKNVSILNNFEELENYHSIINKEYVIQEFIDFPIELAVLYSRIPGQKKGIVSSITSKKFLSVLGNGTDTIETLLLQNPRAKLIWNDLQRNTKFDSNKILAKDEEQIIEKIGNHCRGTIFLNASNVDKEKAALVFDEVLKDFEGFNYGRFDLKIKTLDEMYLGNNIKILELNGVNADAAHIFDPEYTLLKAYKDVIWHWNRLSEIAKINSKNGRKGIGSLRFIKKNL